ncbi:hypothetical protein B9Z19DRAFT_1132006 [Tuber borchii]|uniref:Uncharacterized protein n=1 Tax=Tuber borchii TaxID=42251 RepID=A0A2T6ZHV5_TUBBO|nr:hypothetical protein B9Z19DRAFT_1132006 [Tuber borchii]
MSLGAGEGLGSASGSGQPDLEGGRKDEKEGIGLGVMRGSVPAGMGKFRFSGCKAVFQKAQEAPECGQEVQNANQIFLLMGTHWGGITGGALGAVFVPGGVRAMPVEPSGQGGYTAAEDGAKVAFFGAGRVGAAMVGLEVAATTELADSCLFTQGFQVSELPAVVTLALRVGGVGPFNFVVVAKQEDSGRVSHAPCQVRWDMDNDGESFLAVSSSFTVSIEKTGAGDNQVFGVVNASKQKGMKLRICVRVSVHG